MDNSLQLRFFNAMVSFDCGANAVIMVTEFLWLAFLGLSCTIIVVPVKFPNACAIYLTYMWCWKMWEMAFIRTMSLYAVVKRI